MKAEAFRDDVAARNAAWNEARAQKSIARAFAGIQGDSLTFTGVDLGVSHVYVGTDSGFPFQSTAMDRLANPAGSGMVGYIGGGTDREWHFTHTDGTQFSKVDPAPGESYGAWAMKCAEEAERNRMWCAQERAARKSGKVTLTWRDDHLWIGGYVEGVQASDRSGIAAMAAKAVQPTPDPVVSVLGQQVAQSELTEALALIRQKNAPPAEKETPRGLLCVRDFDRRLGAWGL